MTVRPPSRPPKPPPNNPATALDYEIAREKAATLGRLGRALEAALAALADFDAAAASGAPDPTARADLLAKAGHALWLFVVQREACGLRDSRAVMRDYRVPAEVQVRMGAFPPR